MKLRDAMLAVCALALITIAAVLLASYFGARADAKAERIRRAVQLHDFSDLPPEWQDEALRAEIEQLERARRERR